MNKNITILFLVMTMLFLQGMEDQSSSKKRKKEQHDQSQVVGSSALGDLRDNRSNSPIIRPIFENIEKVLIKLIKNEQESIKIAMYCFLSPSIAGALKNAKNKGVKIDLIVDSEQMAKSVHMRKLLENLCCNQIDVWVCNELTMHNKFSIFSKNSRDRSFVATGSYNFTSSAENNNRENVVIISSNRVTNAYLQEFKRLVEGSKRLIVHEGTVSKWVSSSKNA